jgi:anti-sigma regulatory factor (Ser/Thr protein kinase)
VIEYVAERVRDSRMVGVAHEDDGSAVVQVGLRHEALFYRDEDEFLGGTLPMIEGAIGAGHPVMVAVGPRKVELLRDELGDTASAVEFADVGRIGRNPTRLISIWRDFAASNMGADRIHGIGEPAWAGREPDELTECSHHEALLNRAFEGGPPFRLMCPYDTSGLDGGVLEHALRNHPWIVDATGTRASASYLDPERMPDPLADPLADPPPEAERVVLSAGADLPRARAFVREQAAGAELAPERITDVVFALNELATNSLVHGGGWGTVYSWRRPGAVVFEVRDRGRIPDAMLGRARPDAAQAAGRGLWLVNELCDLVQVRSGDEGSRVRLWLTTED